MTRRRAVLLVCLLLTASQEAARAGRPPAQVAIHARPSTSFAPPDERVR